MKNAVACLLICISTITAHAQIIFGESVVAIGQDMRPSLFTDIDAEPAPLAKEWRSFLRSQYKIKTRSSRGVISATQALMKDVSDRQLDLYTLISPTPDGSRFELAVSLGNDNFITSSSNPVEAGNLRVLLDGFLKQYLSAHFTKLISEKEKTVKSLERETSKLENVNRKLENRISKDTRSIEQMKKRIDGNSNQLNENTKKIPENRQIIEQKKKSILDLMNERGNLYQN